MGYSKNTLIPHRGTRMQKQIAVSDRYSMKDVRTMEFTQRLKREHVPSKTRNIRLKLRKFSEPFVFAFLFLTPLFLAEANSLKELAEDAPSLASIQTPDQAPDSSSEELSTDAINFLRENNFRTSALDLATVIARAKNQNYSVRQEAERKFQAKKRVNAAIGNLLPHLSAGSILSVALAGPAGMIELVGDLLPFLFPSNWFQMKATKRLLEAEKKSFASLRGNEVFDAESLFYGVSRDEKLAVLIDSQISWINKIVEQIGRAHV